jgi:hypothetical protein
VGRVAEKCFHGPSNNILRSFNSLPAPATTIGIFSILAKPLPLSWVFLALPSPLREFHNCRHQRMTLRGVHTYHPLAGKLGSANPQRQMHRRPPSAQAEKENPY